MLDELREASTMFSLLFCKEAMLTSSISGTAYVYPIGKYLSNCNSQYASTLVLPKSDPYHLWEERWLSKPDTIPRYIRAAKWHLADGKKRIKATLEWRREFKPDIIPPEDVRIESETGKM